ncbi:MAG: hypothetical protein LIO79_02805 [Rikenellaceae bacterium]|nr:hypothetical protein [Rikenellaceae bacterium]
MRIFLKILILTWIVVLPSCSGKIEYPYINGELFTLFAEESGLEIYESDTELSPLVSAMIMATKTVDSLSYDVIFEEYYTEDFAKEVYLMLWEVDKEEFAPAKMQGSKRAYGNMQSFSVENEEIFSTCTRIGNTIIISFGSPELRYEVEEFLSKTGYNLSGKK